MCDCMGPKSNPDVYRITKLNSMRVKIIHDIDDYSRYIDELLEYGLKTEADYIKDTILKDLRKQEAGLYKLIVDANPDVKYTSEEKSETEQGSTTVTCPECGLEGDNVDSCPDCGYDFKSDNNKEDA